MKKIELTVLVVEDDEAVLAMYSLSLQKRFTHILTAKDGLEGWEIFQREWKAGRVIPVVVTDAMMPRMDGMDLMQQVLKLSPATQIIIVSGFYKGSITIHTARENVTYLPKPLDVMLLNIAVMKAHQHYPQALWLERLKSEVKDKYFTEDVVLDIIRAAPWLEKEAE